MISINKIRTYTASVCLLLCALHVVNAENKRSINISPAALENSNTVSKLSDNVLKIRFVKDFDWPHLIVNGKWDFSAYTKLSARVKNTGQKPIRLEWRICNPGGDWSKDSVTIRTPFAPGEERVIFMPLKRKASDKDFCLHGMKQIPDNFAVLDGADLSNIVKMEFVLPRGKTENSVEISEITASGTYKPIAGKILPLIDQFGQYTHADWPGKIKTIKQMREAARLETADLKANPAPAEWNKYGGWANGPQLKATGAFRVQKYQGKWTLVDPEGRLFFSLGVNHVNIGGIHSSTALFNRNGWFARLPSPNNPANQKFYYVRYIYCGDYSGNYSPGFSFIEWNLNSKYGKNWKKISTDLAPKRLRSWGLNTIANWSDYSVYRSNQLPYTAGVALEGSGCRQIGGTRNKFKTVWDVYDPNFAVQVNRLAKSMKNITDSPWCIGLFIDNELHWGSSLALLAINSKAEEPAKQALMKMLKDKYKNIAKLNAAWKTTFANWKALADNRNIVETPGMKTDFDAFYLQTAETYYKIVRDAIRKHCPGKLYLGPRFASSQYTPLSFKAAAKYCDIVSFNIYYRSLDNFTPDKNVDAPIMSTEYHFGATDRGMFGPGLVPVENQTERADMYKQYVTSALKHPNFVGCHWFQYCDQPTTGRIFDGENYNIGFVNVTDTPYNELINASREIGNKMYKIRFQNK